MSRARSLAAVAALTLFMTLAAGTPARAAVITVTATHDDSPTFSMGDEDCSLREAIQAANTNAEVDGCAAGSATETDTITLGNALTYTLTQGDTPIEEDGNQTGDLDVGQALIIQGNGSIVDADGLTHGGCLPAPDRVFHVLDGVDLQISSLTVQGGGGIFDADCNGGGTGEIVDEGGGFRVETGASLTLDASTVRRNTARDGGGIYSNGHVELLNGTVVGDADLTDANEDLNRATNGSGGGIFTQPARPRTLIVDHSKVNGNVASEDGGGIFNLDDRVEIRNGSEVSDNTAGDGSGNGGGIWTSAPFSDSDPQSRGLFVTDSVIARNQAHDCGECGEGNGGGIYNINGHVEITGGSVVGPDNASDLEGGGIWTATDDCFPEGCETLILEESTVRDNISGANGAGIYSSFDSVSLTMSTVSGNETEEGDGGGIWMEGEYANSELEIDEVALSAVNSTISNNSGGRGGGIYLAGGPASFRSVTMATNHALIDGGNLALGGNGPETDLHNTILSLGDPQNCHIFDQSGVIESLGFNLGDEPTGLATADTCELDQPSDILNTDAQLGNLAPNPPGETETHALLSTSPAIDTGATGEDCPSTDQRGVARPQDGNGDGTLGCDRGAYERVGQVEQAEAPPPRPPLPPLEECDIIGTAAADVLVGTDAAEQICGLEGDDVIRGGGGNDSLFGNEGDDVLVGGMGDDGMVGGPGSDTGDYSVAPGSVDADLERQSAVGEGASTDGLFALENLIGSPFPDRLAGTDGPNILKGKNSDDRIVGRGGNDFVRGARGKDFVRGGSGNDVLKTGHDPDAVRGGKGDDVLTGGQRRDDLRGNAGDDHVRGGGANDKLNGNAHFDTCNGGYGTDAIVNCEEVARLATRS